MTFQPFDFVEQDSDSSPTQTPEWAGQYLLGRAEGTLAAPGSLGEFFHKLADFLPQDQASKKIRRGITSVLFPQLSGRDLPSVKKLEKMAFGEKFTPTTAPGRIARQAGEFTGLGSLGGPVSKGAELLPATAGALGATARELNFPEPVSSGIEAATLLTGKNIGRALVPHVEGSLRDSLNPKQLAFYDSAKEIGLTDAEITPLLQSDRKIDLLGPFAKKTKAAKEALKETEEGIGSLYKPVKEQAASYGDLTQEQLGNFNQSLKKDLENLNKTVEPSKNKNEAIEYLENSLTKLEGNIIGPDGKKISYKFKSPEDIINFFQDINEQGLWDKLKPVKDTIRKTLHQIDPVLGKKFDLTNEMFSKIKHLRQKVGVGEYEKLISFGERAAIVGTLAKGLIFGGGFGMAGVVLGEILARRVATKMLFDPRWQGILKNTVQAAKQGSSKAGSIAYKQLKEKVQEDFPKESENIDWFEN